MGGGKTSFHKYPFVKQQALNDCAVACLLMIIKYHHGDMAYDTLFDLTNTNQMGTTAYHLIEGAKQIGFKAYGIKCEINDINQMILPAIAHLKLENGYHYVVVYKIDIPDSSLIIGDPSEGIKKYSFLEFVTQWTGVMIILYPKENLKLTNDKINLKGLVFPAIKKYNFLLVKIFILSFILGISYFIVSFYTQIIIDNSNTEGSFKFLYLISMFIFVVYLIKHITNYIRNHILAFLTRRTQALLTSNIIRRLLFLPYTYYDKRTSGEVVSKLNDFSSVQDFIQRIFIYISFDLVLLLISSIVLISFYSQIFYINLFFLVVDIVITICLDGYYKKYNCHYQNEKDHFNNTVTEMLIGYESIKGIGVEENIYETVLIRYHALLKREESIYNLSIFHNFVRELLQDIAYISQLLLIAFLIIKDDFPISHLFTYQLFSGYFSQYVTNGIFLVRDYKKINEILTRISFLFLPNKFLPNKDIIINKITFTNFKIGYNEDLISDFSLSINSGDKVLMKGFSGSGKSTILKAIMNYYDIKRGQLFLNNIDINDFSNDDITKNITYVNQNGYLFTNSLYYNLVLNRQIKTEEIDKIIKLCHIDEIMIKHNLGLNMWINENGQNLSGGERQRIILGRALLNNFKVLLLDEATNQMDKKLEEKIMGNIFSDYQDSIIIVVSHQKEVANNYNYILKIENKKVVIE